MKRNVDLSENMIFTTPEEPTGLTKLLLDALKITKPWDYENNPCELASDLDLNIISVHRTLFCTGTKKERQIWKRSVAEDRGETCFRCGYKKDKKPWGVKTCNCFSMSYMPDFPWKF